MEKNKWKNRENDWKMIILVKYDKFDIFKKIWNEMFNELWWIMVYPKTPQS